MKKKKEGSLMDIQYDKFADTLYIKFGPGSVKESDELSPGIILDYSAEDKIIAIEILNFSERNIDLNHIIKLPEEELIAQVSSM
ncbi:MAG: DUF2283 domain-containing protein [Candidatus Kariarchaeaceae archaeon]|jgi:uncharacterized protein YuzE